MKMGIGKKRSGIKQLELPQKCFSPKCISQDLHRQQIVNHFDKIGKRTNYHKMSFSPTDVNVDAVTKS